MKLLWIVPIIAIILILYGINSTYQTPSQNNETAQTISPTIRTLPAKAPTNQPQNNTFMPTEAPTLIPTEIPSSILIPTPTTNISSSNDIQNCVNLGISQLRAKLEITAMNYPNVPNQQLGVQDVLNKSYPQILNICMNAK